jgi:hypothetical protein
LSLDYSIDNVRSTSYDGMTGMQIEKEMLNRGFILTPNGKIFYGGFNVIDEQNGKFTLIDQDYNDQWSIEAKSLRSLKLKLTKLPLEPKSSGLESRALSYNFKDCIVKTRLQWDAEISKRDQIVTEQQAELKAKEEAENKEI